MNVAGDFSQLYERLGISADCSLPDFKQACRRRIRAQHPDRTSLDELAAVQPLPLDELLPLYARALRFHRRHGRLPGATLAGGRGAPPGAIRAAGAARPPAFSPPSASAPASAPTGLSMRGPALAVAGIAIVLLLVGVLDDDIAEQHRPDAPLDGVAQARSPAIDGSGIRAATLDPAASDDLDEPVAQRLELGMDTDTVLAIQGAPMQRAGAEWLYGPSWVRFEHGQVVGWYSSPLHRLKTTSDTPDEGDQAAPLAGGS